MLLSYKLDSSWDSVNTLEDLPRLISAGMVIFFKQRMSCGDSLIGTRNVDEKYPYDGCLDVF